MPDRAATSPVPCPRCGVIVPRIFEGTGVCARCAGERLLSLAAADAPAPAIAPDQAAPAGPESIGPYTIIDELGHGGMGIVYLAQHLQLGRIVALKTIRASREPGPDLELRFLREAQTMARLRHPHIVAVHDAGRADGHAYFAMDYVEGGDLARRRREQRRFTPAIAARLLHAVASAVAYSHAEGVLHRDLKPSNILLEGDEPRVADFGLAAQLAPGSGLTAHTAVLGTPHYLAPEALCGRRGVHGGAGDIYALGVILYELIAGRTPFVGAAPAELAALVATADPPPLRLLAPQVPRDLEVICAKCLELEPDRRYATAVALVEDLRRFLAGEPIAARPISTPSRLWRWTRRRPAIAATWLLSVLLAAASTTTAVLINRERLRADAEAVSYAALAEFLAKDVLGQSASAEAPDRDLKFRTVLDRAAEITTGRFDQAPLTEATVRHTLGTTYDSLGEYAPAERQFRRAAALRQKLGPDHPETMRARNNLGVVLAKLEKHGEAEALFSELVEARRRVSGGEHPSTLLAMKHLALSRGRNGRLEEAIALVRELIAISTRSLGPEHATTLNYLRNLAAMLLSARRYDEALAPAQTAYGTSLRELGADDNRTLAAAEVLASTLGFAGRFEEAEVIWRQTAATLVRTQPDHWRTHFVRGLWGKTLVRTGHAAEAEPILRESYDALRSHQAVLPASRRRTPEEFAQQLAQVYSTLGRPDDAEVWRARAAAPATGNR